MSGLSLGVRVRDRGESSSHSGPYVALAKEDIETHMSHSLKS